MSTTYRARSTTAVPTCDRYEVGSALLPQSVGGAIVPSTDAAIADQLLPSVTVPLRMGRSDGGIRTVQIVVIDLDDLTEELRLDDHTIGFIYRAGHVFVAQSGTRLDRAEECGQHLLWDKAAAMLVPVPSRSPESSCPDRRGASQTSSPKTSDDVDSLEAQNHHVLNHEMSN